MSNYSSYGIEVKGRRTGKIKTVCPNCRDKRTHPNQNPSLSVDLNRGIWNCHYCGWAGKLKDETNNWFNPQRLEHRKREYKRPKPLPAKTKPYSDKMIAYFASRGISQSTLEKLKITEGKEKMSQDGREYNTIQFNYFRDGELVNVKYRTGNKMFKMITDAELLPYNIDAIKDVDDVIITEGEIDALSFVECGIDWVVSVPNGANSNLSWLDDYQEIYFDRITTFYLAVDTDSKGTELSLELQRRLGHERCKIVAYGEGCKDANEHLVKFGKDSLLECLNGAKEVHIDGIYSVQDIESKIDLLYTGGLAKGLLVGIETMDKAISFESKRLCIITGKPSSGKSEIIDFLVERFNILYGWKTAYFSPENFPLELHYSKIAEKFTGKNFSSQTLKEHQQAKEYLRENIFFIMPDEDFSIDNILDKARALVRQKGIKVLVIDPYNRLESQQGNRSETQYISFVLDKLTTFAQINDILVFLMAHPTKPRRNKDGEYEKVTLYDISGSANFYNKADYGIVISRDREKDVTIFDVQKIKFRHLGDGGEVILRYNTDNGRYVEEHQIAWDNTNHIKAKLNPVPEDKETISDPLQTGDYDNLEFPF
jgi:twinkle protein